jgi:GNAT superfamily N-acetyltransferase
MATQPFDTSQLTLNVQLVTDPFGDYKASDNANTKYDDFEDVKKMMASMKVRDGDDLATDNDYTDGESAFEDFEEFQDEGYISDAESDYDLYDPWLKVYHTEIKTTSGNVIGQFTYRVVNVSARVVGEDNDLNLVWKIFDSSRSGKSLKEFIATLYDKETGLLCPEYLPGGSRAGTGVFKDELNTGSFAYLSADNENELFLDEQYRGRGIGNWVLDAMKKQTSLEGVHFIFVAGEKGKNDARVLEFFRKNGFRRVGQSPYFAYALRDTKHPSRMLDATEDAEYQPQSCTQHLAVANPLAFGGL